MLGVADGEMEIASQKLLAAGFVRESWSYSSSVDPATRINDERYHLMQAHLQPAFENFDRKTMRFHYPDATKGVQQTILLPASYIRLCITNPSQDGYADPATSLSQPPFYVEDNLHWPNVTMLLQSFLMAYLEEAASNRDELQADFLCWGMTYLARELELRYDILDSCRYASVKELFDKTIERHSGRPRPQRQKWGKPRQKITNDMIAEFQ